MSYNLTNMSQNVTGLLTLTQNVNDTLTFGRLGTMFLIAISFIILTSFLFTTNDVKRSLAATSFLSFGIALFLRTVGLVPNLAIYITLVACALSLALTWKKG